MRINSAHVIQKRIIKVASELDCKNISLAKQGKASNETNFAIFEMMFIYKFLPFFDAEQRRQKECFLNEKYGI